MMRALSVAAILLLGACVAPPLEGAPPAPTAQLSPLPPAPAPAPVAEVAQPPAPPPAQPPAEVAIVLPPPAPPAPRVFDPTELNGKQREEVIGLLGGPSIARREPGAELLLYEGQGCVLYVFLYDPPAGGAAHVEYTEVGPRTRDPSRDRACLLGMLQSFVGG